MRTSTPFIRYIGLLLTMVLIGGCKKDADTDVYHELTKSEWTFMTGYHAPPAFQNGFIEAHIMEFKTSGSIHVNPPWKGTAFTWNLNENLRDIEVNRHVDTVLGPIAQIWEIQLISDTLLDIRIRDASEPVSTQNYWGMKYWRP